MLPGRHGQFFTYLTTTTYDTARHRTTNMQHTAMMCIERAHHTWDEYFQLSGWGSGLFDMCEAAREAALGPRGPGKRSIHAGACKYSIAISATLLYLGMCIHSKLSLHRSRTKKTIGSDTNSDLYLRYFY